MDQTRPFVRAERTFWTVWNYITEVVGRFLRPVATDIGNNDTSSGQEHTADREADNCSDTDRDVRGGGEDDKQAVDSPRPVVAWEQPTITTGSGTEKEDSRYTVEFSGGSHASEEGEGTTEKQVALTEDEETGRQVTQDVSGTEEEEVDENNEEELHLCGKDEIKIDESNEHNEHENITRSPSTSDAALGEDVGEIVINSRREEETDRVMIPIPDDQRKVDEAAMTQFQAKKGEETKEVPVEDEPGDLKDPHTVVCSEVEEKAGKLCTFKDMSPEEKNNMYIEDLRRQEKAEDGGVTNEAALGEETERRDGVLEPLVHLGLDEELTESTEPEAGETSRMEDEPVIEIDVQSEKTTAAIEEDVVGLLEETVDSSETELKSTTEAGLSDESMDAEASDEKVAPEGIVETTLMEQLIPTGLKLLADKDLQDREMEIQGAMFEMEGIPDSGTVEKAAENESGNDSEETASSLENSFKPDEGLERRDGVLEPLVHLGLDEELTESTEPEAGETSRMEDEPVIEIDVQSEKTTAAIEEDVVGLLEETVDSSETELKSTTEAGLSDESMDAEASDEKVAPEGIVETTLMEQLIPTGLKLLADKDLQDREMKIQGTMFEMEGIPDSGTVEKAAEKESGNDSEETASSLENSFKPDEGLVEPVAGEVQDPLLICKEVSFEDSAVVGGPGIVASEAAIHAELEMTYDKRGIVSGDEITVVGQEQMMGEGIERIENDKVEDQSEEWSIVVERKQGIENEEENDRAEEVITSKILNTVIEQEDCLKAVREDSKEEHTEHAGVCERVTEDVEIELHRAGFEDGDQDNETDVLATVTKPSDDDAFEQKSAEVSGLSFNLGTMIAKESELTGIAISVDERFDVTEKDKIEQETMSSKEETISDMEEMLAPIAVTVEMESNNTVEVSGELKDISPVVPREPGSVACDETQEDVPEYNNGNELDEDTTQWILEAGDSEEIRTTQLPEKFESEEPESFENIVGIFKAGHLLVSERKEAEQDSKSESTEHIERILDMVVEGQTEIPCFTDIESPRETDKPSADPMNDEEAQVSGCSFVAEVGPLAASAKTEPRQSENAFESGTDSVDDTQGTEAELCDDTDEPLVHLGLDEELTESTEPEAGETSRMEDEPVIEIDVESEKTTAAKEEDVVGLLEETVDSSETELKSTTEAGLSDESMDAEASDEKVAPEGIVETTLMEQLIPTGLKLLADEDLQDKEMEVQGAMFEMEGIPDSGTVEKAAENESGIENDSEVLNLQTVETTAGLLNENNGIENALIVASEPPEDNAELSVESVETKHELSEKPFQTSNQDKMTDTELSDESMEVESEPEDEIVISKGSEQDGLAESMIELMQNYAEKTGKPVIGHGNETDEEILDMWIEPVVSEDRDDTGPKIIIESTEKEPVEESEPGLQRGKETPPLDEGPDEKLSEQTEEEQSVELTEEKLTTESGSVSEAEISETSPSAESGFSDQSIGELDPPENEAQLLKYASSGLFQGILETADSLSETAEILISDLTARPSETEDRLIEQTGEAGQSYVEEDQFAYTIPVQGFLGKPTDTTVVLSETKLKESADESQEKGEPEKVETETGLQKEIIPEISNSEAKATEAKSPTEIDALFRGDLVEIKDEPLEKIVSYIPNEIQECYLTLSNETGETESVLHREGSESEALLGERVMSKESGLLGETVLESHYQLTENKVHLLDKVQHGWSEETDGSLPGLNTEETTEALLSSPPRTTSGDQLKVDASILDFTPQKSRIAVKNPHVRPPKDPRTLLQMPSVEPSPPNRSGHLPIKGLAVVPMGGLGIGIKLPGLGSGSPVLKKTQKGARDEKNSESLSQKSETEAEIKDESPKEEVERKPKWMPPRHPGFGNPLMSELKTKLKKTTKE